MEISPVPEVADAPLLRTLAGTRWLVVEMGGLVVAPLADPVATQNLEFDAAGQLVTGNTGVNRFGGRCRIDGAKLSFGPIAVTRRAGPPERMEAERRYTWALSQVAAWRQAGSNLELMDAGGGRVLLLVPNPPR